MAGNTTPIYSKVGDVQWNSTVIVAANTAVDGTGTVGVAFTADATNGGRLEKLRIKPLGTNVVTVMRFFVNNGSTNTVAANNQMYGEVALAATTVTQIAALPDIDYLFPIALPPGYRIIYTLGTAVAAGFGVTGVGGKF